MFRLAIVLVFALTLTGAGRTARELYNSHQKAAYIDPQVVAFVRPGLVIKVNSASIAADGTMTAVVTITDPQGLALDQTGITTPGVVTLSFMVSAIPNGGTQYQPYILTSITGAAGTFPRPTAENSSTTTTGKLTSLGNGQYQYVFGAKAPAGYDKSATTTVAVFGNRNLTPFNLPTNYASTTFNFVPDGSNVTTVRDVVATKACNSCHDQLSFHGGQRRGVELCVMCHTTNMVDSATGNSIDLKVFIHKLHAGSSLPSVVAGKKYMIGSTDFSEIVYPADVRRCETCHDPKSATQANNYLTNPTAEACGSCHDNVNFATGVNHAGGPQPNNAQCAMCHNPQGELEFDASIKGAHVIPQQSSYLTGLAVKIAKVTNTNAGQKPTVTFNILDKNGNGQAYPAGGTLSFVMSGPTTDYGNTNFGADTAASSIGYVSESVTAAACDATGNCSYTFNHAIPAGSTGSFAIGVQARRTETILAGTTKQQSVQYGAKNSVVYFSVDGSPVAPRRTVANTANCNRCHVDLELHGNQRNQVEFCVLCHNPSMTDFPTRPQATDATLKNMPNQGVAFDMLVHRIHTGENLKTMGKSYTVVGFGGAPFDATEVKYPAMSPTGKTGDTRNCTMCHNTGTAFNLPLGKNAVTDPQGPINPDPAISAACTGCHASLPTASHAMANTTAVGESCQACHAAGAQGFNGLGLDYAVDKVHAQY